MDDQRFVPSPTAVQDGPAPPTTPVAATPADGTWTPPPVPQRRGLEDRWRGTPGAARLGLTGAVAFLLLLAFGVGGFAIGRGTAPRGGTTPDATTPAGFTPGDRPEPGTGGPAQGGPQGDLVPPDLQSGQQSGQQPDQPDQGTDGGSDGAVLSWYVVPPATPAAGAVSRTTAA